MGLWQAETELLRIHYVNFPKKSVNQRGLTWDQFIWDLVGGFILDLRISLSHGDAYKRIT